MVDNLVPKMMRLDPRLALGDALRRFEDIWHGALPRPQL